MKIVSIEFRWILVGLTENIAGLSMIEHGVNRVSDQVYLEQVIVPMRVGCSEQERNTPQLVRFDVSMVFDCRAAGASDKLLDTLDYVKAYRLMEEIAQSQVFLLLERFCELYAQALLDLGAEAVRIRASKEQCPIPGLNGRVGVEIERSRNDVRE